MQFQGRLLLLLFLLIPTLPVAAQPDKKQLAEDEKLLQANNMPTEGEKLVQFLQQQTLTEADEKQIDALIGQLDHKLFRVREKAAQQLIELGSKALAPLRQAARKGDLETQTRAKECIISIEKNLKPGVHAAAVRLLAARQPEAACKVLFDYLPHAVDKSVQDSIEAKLVRVGVRKDKVDPVLVAGLDSARPVQRAIAALVVGRSGTGEQRQRVQKLLKDAELPVRYRAAQGLLMGKDTTGVPLLLNLLEKGPFDLAETTDDMFRLLAGDKAPQVILEPDNKARAKSRQAWENWWEQKPEKLAWKELAAVLPGSGRDTSAGRVSQQFVTALIKGDSDTLRKITDVPFYFGPGFAIPNHHQLLEIFQAAESRPKDSKIAIRVVSVDPLAAYLKKPTTPRQKRLLEELAKSGVDLFVVEVQDSAGAKSKNERTALIARRHNEQTHIIGILPEK